MEAETPQIRIMVISSRGQDLDSTIQFLNRRNCLVSVQSTLQGAAAELSKSPPDWLFLSVNLSSMIDKFVNVLRRSFDIDPILFGDVIDHKTLSRLSHYKAQAMPSKLTGPSVLLKISQLLNQEQAVRHRLRPRSSSGVRKSAFESLLVKGEGTTDNGSVSFAQESSSPTHGGLTKTPDETPLTGMARATTAELTATGRVVTPFPSKPNSTADHRADALHVMVSEEEGRVGYLVMGLSGDGSKSAKEKMKNKILGPLKSDGPENPKWDELRALLTEKTVAGAGEVLSCFVPLADPLPEYQMSTADLGKLGVPLASIPAAASLPCSVYVYLPQNEKFVCLIKPHGYLSPVQQERLLKQGLKSLMIAKEDKEIFELFYIRNKLGLGAEKAEEPLAAPLRVAK